MPIPTRATLKSYFETNDQPTQAQFAELIDAIFDLAQFALDEAEAAVDTAEAAAANAPKVVAYFRFDKPTASSADPTVTAYRDLGCTVSIAGGITPGILTFTVTFDVANADALYNVHVYATHGTELVAPVALPLITKTATEFTFEYTISIVNYVGGGGVPNNFNRQLRGYFMVESYP